MAHKKGAGSSRNGRESHSKRLGIKIYGGQAAIAGNIIVRQRGTKHHPGVNVGIGRDHTLFALTDGTVLFRKKQDNKSYVSVVPSAPRTETVETAAPKKVKTAPVADTTPEVAVAEAPIMETPTETTEAPKKAKAAPKAPKAVAKEKAPKKEGEEKPKKAPAKKKKEE